MKIFGKLFLLLVLIAGLPLGVTAVMVMEGSEKLQRELLQSTERAGETSANTSGEALEERARATLLQVVQEKSRQLQTFFENIRRAVLLESTLIEHCLYVDAPIRAPEIYSADQVADWLEDKGDNEFRREIHARKEYISYQLAPGVAYEDVEDPLRRLRQLGYFFAHNQRALPWCMSTYLGHRGGVIVGYPGRSRYSREYDPRKRPWFKQAAEARHQVWTDLYLDRNKTDVVITCANPVYDPSRGELHAVAALDIKLTQIMEQAFDLGEIKVSDAVIVDGRGKVRLSRNYESGGDQSGSGNGAILKPATVEDYKGGVFLPAWREIQAGLDRGSDLVDEYDEGESAGPGGSSRERGGGNDKTLKSLFGFGRFTMSETRTRITPEGEDPGPPVEADRWTYVAKMSAEEIFRPVAEIRATLGATQQQLQRTIELEVDSLWRQIAVLMTVFLLATCAIAYAVAKATTRPLEEMALVAERVGKGDLDQNVTVRGRDELGQMAKAINGMIAGLKERDFIKSTFKRYVSASVVEQLLKDPDKLKIGGERREMTVFFSDLAGFTSISEAMSPEDLVAIINEYLDEMTEAIFRHRGTLDKYVGDAIMAFWGAPLEQDDHAFRACAAALDNIASLDKLWKDWRERGLPAIDMRIGINTGPMVVGNMGSTVQMNYTAMGDSVNLGARLEGANKAYGTRIMISEATRQAAGKGIEARELDVLAVKGKNQGIRVYELLGLSAAQVPVSSLRSHGQLAGQVDTERLAGCRLFEQGLAAYRARDWDLAETKFAAADKALGGDKASRVFLERVAHFREKAPPADWDGTWTLTTK